MASKNKDNKLLPNKKIDPIPYLDKVDDIIKNYSNYNLLNNVKNPFYQLSIVICILMSISSLISNIKYISSFLIYFTIALIAIYLCSKYFPKRDRNFAMILTLIPIIPANRIYINHFDAKTIMIRIIPIIGNIFDLYHMFHTKKMVNDEYWIS
tara:strand:- start:1068 stop:1526 length:459 start_codon:yes stop_codon:yes gene_type:complete